MAELVDAVQRLNAWQLLCVFLALAVMALSRVVVALWKQNQALHGERKTETVENVKSNYQLADSLRGLTTAITSGRNT